MGRRPYATDFTEVELPPHISHGTHTGYGSYGCHCRPCRAAHLAYNADRRAGKPIAQRRGHQPVVRPTVLSADEVAEIRDGYVRGLSSYRALAEEYGVSMSTIVRVMRGQ